MAHDLEAPFVLPALGCEVVPCFDLGEGAFGPGVDGIEEADEEVRGESPYVDLVLGGGDSVEELLFAKRRIMASKSMAKDESGVPSQSRSTSFPSLVIE
ncbi:MAG: hypothetical protein ACREA0_22860 [bacterium]